MKQISINNRIWYISLATCLLFMVMAGGIEDTYARYVVEKNKQVVYGAETAPEMTWEFIENSAEAMPVDIEDIAMTEGITTGSGRVSVLQGLNEAGPVMLKITYPADSRKAVFTVKDGLLPKGLCYSTDGIKGTILKEDGGVVLTTETILLIQPPQEWLENKDGVELSAYFQLEDGTVEQTSFLIEPTQNNTYSWDIVLQQTTAPVLGGNNTLVWNTIGGYSNEIYRVSIEQLTKDGYVALTENGSFKVSVTVENGKAQISLSNDAKADAGTYRMVVKHGFTTEQGNTLQLPTAYVAFLVNYR